ncbi:hypothetical protein [Streptomyces sp. TLI_146]|uniref:hypothetical protein n=1 Tax=Streptomyces sp. TLI_146 TaxID=1938858 RepID=UPI000C713AF1|nr:hypothetical protein [Streptomyces sp. TLI_146]PKV89908.1 hypothetical protein BX283_7555 [Streptomyces sp. TLI_146]
MGLAVLAAFGTLCLFLSNRLIDRLGWSRAASLSKAVVRRYSLEGNEAPTTTYLGAQEHYGRPATAARRTGVMLFGSPS